MQRREFIKSSLAMMLTGEGILLLSRNALAHDDEPGSEGEGTITLYDCYAMALYYDGTLGPRTGIVRAQDIVAGVALDYRFWHGHGGQQHLFKITAAHFATLCTGKRVMIETSAVDHHTHTLFIDPIDVRYRVPGATGIEIPAPTSIE